MSDGAGQLGVDPVPRRHQPRGPVQQARRRQAVQVLGGERDQRRCQLAHDTYRSLRSGVEVYREEGHPELNPQVRGAYPQISEGP